MNNEYVAQKQDETEEKCLAPDETSQHVETESKVQFSQVVEQLMYEPAVELQSVCNGDIKVSSQEPVSPIELEKKPFKKLLSKKDSSGMEDNFSTHLPNAIQTNKPSAGSPVYYELKVKLNEGINLAIRDLSGIKSTTFTNTKK